MKKKTVVTISVLILIAVLAMQSAEAQSSGSSIGNSSSSGSSGTPYTQIHNVHIGAGLVDLKCDACHGPPQKITIPTVEKGEGPGHFSVCEQCHAPPPDSLKPSYGNLVTIHLSRGKYCNNCHGWDISSTHPREESEPGKIRPIKCENCHPNPQNIISHVNGGKFCLDCHGEHGSATPVPTVAVTVTVPVATYVTPTATYVTPAATTPPQTYPPTVAQIKKRALLQVTYEIEPKQNREALVSVHLKNIGNATATKINLIINNPSELQVTVLSGSEQTGNTITWTGEIEPGKEHIAKYVVKIVAGKDIEVPLKVTYVKISQEEKAQLLGMSPSVVNTISPEEMEIITLILTIIFKSIPGFEGIMAIVMLLLLTRLKWRRK